MVAIEKAGESGKGTLESVDWDVERVREDFPVLRPVLGHSRQGRGRGRQFLGALGRGDTFS